MNALISIPCGLDVFPRISNIYFAGPLEVRSWKHMYTIFVRKHIIIAHNIVNIFIYQIEWKTSTKAYNVRSCKSMPDGVLK